MKKIALFLALTMVFTAVSIPSLAAVEQIDIKAAVKPVIEVDGLEFKDLNNNGKLDVYEDWRRATDIRIADLISQMTLEEEVGLLFCSNTAGQFSGTYPVTYNYLYQQDCPFEPGADEPNSSGYSAWYYINTFNNRCMLDNANGTPEEQVFVHNEIQKMCEESRLGIPMTFTSDREYNSWGGFIDKPHDAFGVANDPELARKLLASYAKSMKSVGVHVTFEPYSNEIGAYNGENPEYIAMMTALEVGTLENNGLASCTKHWIGRGGDASFQGSRSIAQNLDNWLEGWKAAIGAGCEWIMTASMVNGISNNVPVEYDSASMKLLREELGYQGVIVTDWWSLGRQSHVTGVTNEGVDLATLSGRQLYKMMLENGVDIFGTTVTLPGENIDEKIMANYPDCIINGVKEGEIEKSLVDRAATRVLRFKFNKGLFENPYVDADAAIALCASEEYAASATAINSLEEYLSKPRNITTNEELKAARNPEDVALDEAMQASSAVLIKNEGGILPLKAGAKVYVTASNEDLAKHYAQYISGYGTVVENMADADVLIGDFTKIDDVAEAFVDDAKETGKPIVMSLNCVDPNQWAIDSADALLYLSFNQKSDHGSQLPGFITTTEPWVYAELLFGDKEPTGMIVKEIARNAEIDLEQWKDLAGDQGASDYVRLMLQATMKSSESHAVPENWGDPLICYKYGMRYNEQSDFAFETLIVPTVKEQTGSGRNVAVVTTPGTVKDGEPFTISLLMWNHGGADMMTVKAYDGEAVVGEKLMAVNSGSWRVVELDVTLTGAGEHTINVCGLTGTVIVQ